MSVMTVTARPSTLTQISALHPLPKIIYTVSDLSSIYLLLLCIRWELKKKNQEYHTNLFKCDFFFHWAVVITSMKDFIKLYRKV